MKQSVRSKAEEKFAASQKRTERAFSEQEQDQQRLMERTLRLRTLRLAKETAELEDAEGK